MVTCPLIKLRGIIKNVNKFDDLIFQIKQYKTHETWIFKITLKSYPLK